MSNEWIGTGHGGRRHEGLGPARWAAGGRRGGRGWRRSFEGRRTTADERLRIGAWFTGRLATTPMARADVTVDDDEILVIVALDGVTLDSGIGSDQRPVAEQARIDGFRADTRDQRVIVAEEAETSFGRRVSWGARCGDITTMFTTVNAPVMTRLRMADRQVLDTLIDAGVARSRSDALAWCVRLVADNEGTWIADLRTAFEHVEQVRSRGPGQPGQRREA